MRGNGSYSQTHHNKGVYPYPANNRSSFYSTNQTFQGYNNESQYMLMNQNFNFYQPHAITYYPTYPLPQMQILNPSYIPYDPFRSAEILYQPRLNNIYVQNHLNLCKPSTTETPKVSLISNESSNTIQTTKTKNKFKPTSEQQTNSISDESENIKCILSEAGLANNFKISSTVNTKNGSRKLKKLLYSNPEISGILLPRMMIKEELLKILCNQHGNSFFELYISLLEVDKRYKIWNAIRYDILDVISSKTGFNSFYSLIKTINSSEEEMSASIVLEPYLINLSQSENGGNIINFCLIQFSDTAKLSIINVLISNSLAIIKSFHGLNTLKTLVNALSIKSQILKSKLVSVLKSDSKNILLEKNGCSLITHIIDQWGIDFLFDFVSILSEDFEFYVCQENSSRLVRKISSLLSKVKL